jgi:hypothetical protein
MLLQNILKFRQIGMLWLKKFTATGRDILSTNDRDEE